MRLFEIESKDDLKLNTSIFNSGSLRDEQILKIVLGHSIPKENIEKAYIKGYKAMKVEGHLFPVLMEDTVSILEGILVSNLSPEDLKRIDYYEEGMFGTELLPVHLKKNDEERQAQVYSKHSPKLKVLDQEWNFAEFQKAARPKYIKDTKKWMEKYDS